MADFTGTGANVTELLPPSPPLSSPPPATEEEKSNDLWYIGAIINVVGSVSINLGMNLIKLGHTKRAQLDVPEEEKPPVRKFKSWVIGIVFFTVGNVLNFVSFAFAAQSLLSALGSLQLVCNVFFAYFVNHEPVTLLIILSTACIIGGCVLLVVFGNQSSETYTVDELIEFYTKPAYVVYLVMMAVFVFGFYVLYLHAKKVCRKNGEQGVWYGMLLVSYAIYSALLGSQSVLFGKSISVILRTTFTESNQLGNWYTWVVLPLFTFTALFYVTRMNKGLRMFPAMIIVPVLQIAWTLFSIVSGMLYFQEYLGFNTLKAIMFPVGVLIVFLGVFVLTVCGGRRAPPEEEEEQAVEGEKGAATLEDTLSRLAAGGSKLMLHDNAIFARQEGDPPGSGEPTPASQAHRVSLGQTLRFTSSWAPPSVAVSPASHLNRTLMTNESLRRQRRLTGAASDLNATGASNRTTLTGGLETAASTTTQGGRGPHGPGYGLLGGLYGNNRHSSGGEGGMPFEAPWKNSTYDKNSTLNQTRLSNASRLSETSMMSTMRAKAKTVHSRLTNDLGVETMAGLKLATGFGGRDMPAVSVFAMPTLDFTATTKRLSRVGQGGSQRQLHAASSVISNEAAILSALPKSKFHKGDPEALTTINEASGLPPTPGPVPSSDVYGSYTTSSHMPATSSQAGTDPRGATTPGGGGSTSSLETGRRTPTPIPNLREPTGGTAIPASQSPPKPHAERTLLGMLPGPAFKTGRAEPAGGVAAGGGGGSYPQPGGDPGPPRSIRSVRLADIPEGTVPLPGLGSAAAAAAAAASAAQREIAASGEAFPAGPSRQGQAQGQGQAPGHRRGDSSGTGSGGGASGGGRGGQPQDGTAPARSRRPPSRQLTGGAGGGGSGGPGGAGASLGAVLPEGVPLSTANSVILHESRPGTPPDVIFLGGGGGTPVLGTVTGGMGTPVLGGSSPYHPGWGQPAYSGSQGQGLHRFASPQRLPPQTPQALQVQQQHYQQYQQQLLQQQQYQQYQQQQHTVPLSLLQRVHGAPPMAGAGAARLPPLHLMVPGMPVNPPPSPPHALTATTLTAGHRSLGGAGGVGGGSSVLAQPPSTMTYAQMLSGRLPPEFTGSLGHATQLQQRSLGVGRGHTGSLGGALPVSYGAGAMGGSGGGSYGSAGGAMSPVVVVQSRPHSPHGLSVSRSWAGLGGMGPGAAGGARQSPLRGGLIAHMQRPLRPWQH